MFVYPVILNGGTERIYMKFDKKMYEIAGVGIGIHRQLLRESFKCNGNSVYISGR